MGTTDMPVTTTSDEARKFFNQGVSQMHSFWFIESERSFLQAATLDPEHGDGLLGHLGERRRRLPAGVSAAARSLRRRPAGGGAGAAPEAIQRDQQRRRGERR